MTAHEVVIRLGRPRDLQLRGTRTGASPAFSADITEVTIPFCDRESAEAALREIGVSVRAAHDAGGEDYRPVAMGEVVRTEADARFTGDLARAVREQRAREALGGDAGD